MLSDAVKLTMCERSLAELSRVCNTQAEEDKAIIATLRAEIERLRAALEKISQFSSNPVGSGPAYTQCGKMVRIARAALAQEPTNDR